jgi:hypothetical protein
MKYDDFVAGLDGPLPGRFTPIIRKLYDKLQAYPQDSWGRVAHKWMQDLETGTDEWTVHYNVASNYW